MNLGENEEILDLNSTVPMGRSTSVTPFAVLTGYPASRAMKSPGDIQITNATGDTS